jgi:hypothetical protein
MSDDGCVTAETLQLRNGNKVSIRVTLLLQTFATDNTEELCFLFYRGTKHV